VTGEFDAEARSLELIVYMQEAGLAHLQYPSEAPRLSQPGRKQAESIQAMMEYFYGIPAPCK
jgi:hypothetical protein